MGAAAANRLRKRVFADSAFWIGLRDKQDPFHSYSLRIRKWIVENRALLVISPFIFAETQAYFSRVPEISALVIRDFWENPIVQLEQPTYDDQKKAVEILKHHTDKSYSFADAVSFIIMLRLGLVEVLTFDRHFHQFGRFHVIDGKHI